MSFALEGKTQQLLVGGAVVGLALGGALYLRSKMPAAEPTTTTTSEDTAAEPTATAEATAAAADAAFQRMVAANPDARVLDKPANPSHTTGAAEEKEGPNESKPKRVYTNIEKFNKKKEKKRNAGSEKKKGNTNPEKKPSTKMTHGSDIDKALKEAFGNLGLEDLNVKAVIGKTRVRNHINPLGIQFQTAVEPPQWPTVFEDASRPLIVDIGCAAGRFGLQMAKHEKWSKYNQLGLEIREPLVTRANAWRDKLGLTNVHFISCSANTSLEVILASYPGPIAYVAVQFPDPQFKRRHHKRRVVNEALLAVLSKHMPEDAVLFLTSDVEEAAAQMRDRADLCAHFKREGKYSTRDPILEPAAAAVDAEGLWTGDGKRAKFEPIGSPNAPNEVVSDYGDWLITGNPFGVPTEREVQNDCLKLPVYRALFVRGASRLEAPLLEE